MNYFEQLDPPDFDPNQPHFEERVKVYDDIFYIVDKRKVYFKGRILDIEIDAGKYDAVVWVVCDAETLNKVIQERSKGSELIVDVSICTGSPHLEISDGQEATAEFDMSRGYELPVVTPIVR